MWKKTSMLLVLSLVLLLAMSVTPALGAPGGSRTFKTRLAGAQEAPVPVVTDATGRAVFVLDKSCTELKYVVTARGLDDITGAHIHLGAPGVAGPIIVSLVPGFTGRTTGLISKGTITSADLVGPLAGMTFQDLVDEIMAGNTYVNVHSTAFPAGEIRGQL